MSIPDYIIIENSYKINRSSLTFTIRGELPKFYLFWFSTIFPKKSMTFGFYNNGWIGFKLGQINIESIEYDDGDSIVVFNYMDWYSMNEELVEKTFKHEIRKHKIEELL